ncbi:MAG: chemotaxis response regulator protein-glutamate methylesterase [Thermoleophilia bacterium]|nr:chemotaxis response regulator protein-glutamate methylesterase [Thermoleophilia bacterium]
MNLQLNTPASNSGKGKIRVLVVDDSAYVRKVVREILNSCPDVEVVGTAVDGEDALARVEQLQPDVVTLDLIMPRMDGIQFLKEQMRRKPIPVVVLSIASESGDTALAALEAGAVELVQKPTALASERMYEVAERLAQAVRSAVNASLDKLAVAARTPARPAPTPARPKGTIDLVAIGLSTGGPQALKHVLSALPPTISVPIAVVLHMPVGYTELYARSLNAAVPLEVKEAAQGEPLVPGTVYIAPAGKHLTFRRAPDGSIRAHLDTRPVDSLHRPSIDVMFSSAAKVYGERLLGIVMTGMGNDGAKGAREIKAAGGLVFSEAKETSVIYGMPRAVEEAGLSDRVVPLDQMAAAILEVI